MLPTITVITPVFNTNRELFSSCAQSVCGQTYDSFDWVIVDDGSEQAYAEWLDARFAQADNVTVIHTENNGPSGARNVGLGVASGDAILFVDADDRISTEFLSHAAEMMASTDADIVMGRMENTVEGTVTNVGSAWASSPVLFQGPSLDELRRYALTRMPLVGTFPNLPGMSPYTLYPKLFAKRVLKGLRFEESISYAEDSLFNSRALESASTVIGVDEVWYERVVNLGSITRPKQLDAFKSLFAALDAYIPSMQHYGWKKTDVGMRYLQAAVSLIRDCSLSHSFAKTSTFTRHVLSAAHEQLSWIDESSYVLPRFYRWSIFFAKRRLAVPLVALIVAFSIKSGYR